MKASLLLLSLALAFVAAQVQVLPVTIDAIYPVPTLYGQSILTNTGADPAADDPNVVALNRYLGSPVTADFFENTWEYRFRLRLQEYNSDTGNCATCKPGTNYRAMTATDFKAVTVTNWRVTTDFTNLFADTTINCRTPNTLFFVGLSGNFPSANDWINAADANKRNKKNFIDVIVRTNSSLFCDFSPFQFSSPMRSAATAKTIQPLPITTFTTVRSAILPAVPSSSLSLTAGRKSTRTNAVDTEREVVYEVYLNQPVTETELKKLIDFKTVADHNPKCCTAAKPAACDYQQGANCHEYLRQALPTLSTAQATKYDTGLVPNSQSTNLPTYRWQYVQRFANDVGQNRDYAVRATADGPPLETRKRSLDVKTVASINVETRRASTTADSKPIRLANPSVVIDTTRPKPAPDSAFSVDLDPPKVMTMDVTRVGGDATIKAQPITGWVVVFSKQVNVFRYKKEWRVRISWNNNGVDVFDTDVDTAYTLSAETTDKKTWTLTVSPAISRSGKVYLDLVTECSGDCLKNLRLSRVTDFVAPIPHFLLDTQPTTTSGTVSFPAAANGLRFFQFLSENTLVCTAGFLLTCSGQCHPLSFTSCTAPCGACTAGQVCIPPEPTYAVDGSFVLANSGKCTPVADVAFGKNIADPVISDADRAALAFGLKTDTETATDVTINNQRTFPITCMPGTTPDLCWTQRNVFSIWARAPVLTRDEVYLAFRRIRGRILGAAGLRFRAWSYMCAPKGESATDPQLTDNMRQRVRSPPNTQIHKTTFNSVIEDNTYTYDIQFWSIHGERCVADTFAPVIFQLRHSKKRSLQAAELLTLATTTNQENVQVRTVSVREVATTTMDTQPAIILKKKCSADGIRVTCLFTLDKPGSVVVTVLPEDDIVPSLPKVLSGRDAGGRLAPHVTIVCPTAGVECSGEVAGLKGSTDYIAYAITKDKNNEPNVAVTYVTTRFSTSILATTPVATIVNTDFANIVAISPA
mmetsp:Transcript_7584/g.19135  ORF Transcript_7584/g.19135 Transcript_7584/m.19135 type:complete len:981 (+) Transcript_7584:71-3013(+)